VPATPPFELDIRQFGLWRGAVLRVAAVAAAAMTAWMLGADPAPLGVRAAALLCSVVAIGMALRTANLVAVRLTWDGSSWSTPPLDAAQGESVQGEVQVLIDVGVWMLLRIAPATGSGMRRSTWLPVQRAGSAGWWHALRCAVYSPRLAPVASQGSAVAAASHPPE
jgi:hypothetical protein